MEKNFDFSIGIDDFLDHVTVLPPGEWDPTTRIEPPKSVPNKVRYMNKILCFNHLIII
jgi:hypothetical protein